MKECHKSDHNNKLQSPAFSDLCSNYDVFHGRKREKQYSK